MTQSTEHTLDVPGACLHYELRGSGPLIALIALPMSAVEFAPMAEVLATEHTVLTYDPRGIGRSPIEDPGQDSTPELIADDVHRLLAAVTGEPACVFGSSGGAVTGLELCARHPEQVHTFIAHEPPVLQLLPDRDERIAEVDDIYATYLSDGQGAAFAKFMAAAGFEPPEGMGEPSAQQIADGERMLSHCMRPTSYYQPDIAALRAVRTRIVPAVGAATTARQYTRRTVIALAERLGVEAVEFPGDHGGFLGEPEGCAAVVRRVLGEKPE